MAAGGEKKENTLERDYKQGAPTRAANHGGLSGPALEDGLIAAPLMGRSRPGELRELFEW